MNTEKNLYQWDTGQKLAGCTGLYVDFPIDNEVYRIETVDGMCIIPDELLQTSGSHKVYECMTNNTIRSFAFSVTPRPKPPDYVYTPTERLTFEGLVQKVDDAVADMIRRAESGEFDGYTPIKGKDYFTASEIQQIQNEVSSGAIGEFKTVVDSETDKFNANATEKVNTYNQNDSEKTASYNTNATEKLNAYNSNANNRVAEFDSHTEQIQTDISELKSDLDTFESETVETVVTSTNILNPSVYFTGAIGSDGNLMTDGVYASYRTSDFIALEENTDYYFAIYANNAEHTIATNRKLLLLYDASKQPISETHQNTDGTNQLTFNSSTNAKYVRVSCNYGLFDNGILQLAKGTTAGQLVTYADRTDLLINLGDVPMAQVQDLIDNSGITVTEIGRNLVNPDTEIVGGIQSDGTVATNGSWANYITSDFIELEENTDYVFACYAKINNLVATTRKMILLFDADKQIISGSYQNVDLALSLTFNSSTNAKYARVSSTNATNLQLEKGTTYTPYVPYTSEVVINKKLGDVPMTQAQKTNVLYGKKWAVCGDSFTNGATDNTIDEDGRYYGFRKVYPYFIGNRNDMDIVKFFEGGRTLAYPSDGTFSNSLTNPSADWFYQNIPSDADYITIYLGINDGNHASGSGTTPDGEDATGVITLGTIDDATTATYYGAWNVVLSWLIENRPFAHIGIIVSNGCTNTDWRDAQIAIAEKYGIPYIDLNGDSRTPAMIRSQNPNIASAVKTAINQKQAVNYPSNTHPNDYAHEYESYFIENFLRSI